MLFCLCYVLIGLLCSIIPKNKSYKNVPKDVVIYLVSDGIHTDFIVPAISDYFNWKNILSDAPYQTPFTNQSYVGIGWGDRGFFLDIASWSELTLKVALRAMFIPSETLMHVYSYAKLPTDKKYFEKIHLSTKQYLSLCKYISSYFKVQDNAVQYIPDVGYTEDDNFYKSSGSYHAFNTCNFWINRGLVISGVRMPIWSHLGKSLFYQLKKAKV